MTAPAPDAATVPPTVVVEVVHEAPDVVHVTVLRPDGGRSTETVGATALTGPSAARQVEAEFASQEVELEWRVQRPHWLHDGDLVRLTAPDLDDGDGRPYAVVAGVMPLGGVLVVRSGSGAAVHAPEHLVVVSSDEVPAALLDDLRRRTADGGQP